MKRLVELEEEEITFILKLLQNEQEGLREARENAAGTGSISANDAISQQMVWVSNVMKKMRIYK